MRTWTCWCICWMTNWGTWRLPLLALLAVIGCLLLFQLTPLDLWLQDRLYDFTRGDWLLDRDDPLLRLVFYDGIKKLYIALMLGLVLSLVLFWRRAFIRNRRRRLLILALSGVLVPLVIGGLKGVTNLACPKDLQRYGGVFPEQSLFSPRAPIYAEVGRQRCFPAGHASGGFALLALFYLFRRRRHQVIAVVIALGLGWATGGYKMAIGDHTLGHTLTTLTLAWLTVLLIARALRRVREGP